MKADTQNSRPNPRARARDETQEKIAEGTLSVTKAWQLIKIANSVYAVDKIAKAATENEGEAYLKSEKAMSIAVALAARETNCGYLSGTVKMKYSDS
ncbi:MAG: hypothetical protein GTO23_10190 [Nitrososphaeria archaeon]|nr:hypothetical protein [Nitrososphaeria archaeon]